MLTKTLLTAVLALLFVSPAFAQAPAAPTPAPAIPSASDAKEPDTSGISFIQNLRASGTTVYYLGQTLGLHGWFAVKDRQVQIFYSNPGTNAILVGALLSPEGVNVSQQQISLFATAHPEVMDVLKGGDSAAPPATTPASAGGSVSEKLYADLMNAGHVSFGKDGAPTLLMIMDVNCPHCHKAWKMLEKPVNEGKLRVVMVPIPALGAASATQAAVWLGLPDPVDAWKKHVAGDATVFNGTPLPQNIGAVARNMQIVTGAAVENTPTILYRGKNGKMRLIVGEPQSSDVILKDIGG